MNAHIDVSCEKCGRRFGWFGLVKDQPRCPRCHYRPAQSDLDARKSISDLVKNDMTILQCQNDIPKVLFDIINTEFKDALEVAVECVGNQYPRSVIKMALRLGRNENRINQVISAR